MQYCQCLVIHLSLVNITPSAVCYHNDDNWPKFITECVLYSCWQDLDIICKTLLPKAGESNGFIREDVDKTLRSMVKNATASKVLIALIATGGG